MSRLQTVRGTLTLALSLRLEAGRVTFDETYTRSDVGLWVWWLLGFAYCRCF